VRQPRQRTAVLCFFGADTPECSPPPSELATEYSGKLLCVKLNTDESPTIATDYGIRSIPTVMIFKNGQKLDTVIGAVPKSTLISTIDKYM